MSEISAALQKKKPSTIALPLKWQVQIAYDRLNIEPKKDRFPVSAFLELMIHGPGAYFVPELKQTLEITPQKTIHLAYNSPGNFPWFLRYRRSGDSFHTQKGRGGKKLKDWLIDRKIPKNERDELVILADSNGNVLWIPKLAEMSRELFESGFQIKLSL